MGHCTTWSSSSATAASWASASATAATWAGASATAVTYLDALEPNALLLSGDANVLGDDGYDYVELSGDMNTGGCDLLEISGDMRFG